MWACASPEGLASTALPEKNVSFSYNFSRQKMAQSRYDAALQLADRTDLEIDSCAAWAAMLPSAGASARSLRLACRLPARSLESRNGAKAFALGFRCLILTFVALAGCSSGEVSSASVDRGGNLVISKSHAALVLSELGIDPDILGTYSRGVVAPLPFSLFREIAEQHQGQLDATTLGAYLDVTEQRAAIFEFADGEIKVAIGSVLLGDKPYVQLVGQSMLPELAPITVMRSNPPKSTWLAKSKDGDGVSISIGKATVIVDRLWRTVGVTEPFTEAATTFRILNTSTTNVSLRFISTSCSCTTADIPKGAVLGANESEVITLRVRTGSRAQYRQDATVRLRETDGNAYRDLKLSVFGNQLCVVAATPKQVDFGQVSQGSLAIRTLKLQSSPQDPFRVNRVNCPGMPISAAIINHEPSSKSALNRAILELSVDPDVIGPGEHRSVLQVETTSRYRPVISVPVRVVVRGRVQALPSIVSFGTVKEGSSKERKIDLVSLDGRSFDVKLLKVPEGCDVTMSSGNRSDCLSVAASFRKPGLFEDAIALRVVSDQWQEELVLRCIAIVTPK